MIVVHPPLFDLITGVLERPEQLNVQPFVSESPVKALDKSILHRLTRADEVELNAVLVRPSVHDPTAELTAVIHGDRLWIPSLCRYLIQGMNHIGCRQRTGTFQNGAFPCKLINTCQRPEVDTIFQAIHDKVH